MESSQKKRDYIVYLFSFMIVCFLAFMLCQKCSKTEQIKVNTNDIRDSIVTLDSTQSKLQHKSDTVKQEIIKYKYLLGKDKKYFIHDTIRIDSLIYLSRKQDTIIQIDSNRIVVLKKEISQYQKLDTIQNKTIDSLINAPKGRLKIFGLGVGIGFIIGSVIK